MITDLNAPPSNCCIDLGPQFICITQGDLDPDVLVKLWDRAKCCPLDLSTYPTVVYFRFRQCGEETNVFETDGEILFGGELGYVVMRWPDGGTDVEPGDYEIEVSVDIKGERQTAKNRIKVKVRPSFDNVTMLNLVTAAISQATVKDAWVEFALNEAGTHVELFIGPNEENKGPARVSWTV